MSSRITKYLDIDSTYRDRKQYPNPGQFEVVVSQQGFKSVLESVDPISNQTPYISFTPQDDLDALNMPTLLSSSLFPSPDAINSQNSIVVRFANMNDEKYKTLNYFRGIGVNFLIFSNIVESTTIAGWIFLNKIGSDYCFRINLKNAVSVDLNDNNLTLTFEPQVDFSNGFVHIPTGVVSSQTYKNYYLYNDTNNQNAQIITYDGTIALATFNAPLAWSDTDQVSIRQQLPINYGQIQIGSNTKTLILDPITASTINNAYTGSFIRLISTTTNNNEIRRIVNYTSSQEATVDIPFPESTPGDGYQILQFTKDNYNPIIYNGTQISQDSCYDVQLINLTLPNVNVRAGGVSASYPYFYVVLYNTTTANSGNSNLMYSNNPNTNRVQFKVPVTDTSPPFRDSFLTLDKSYMVQTMKLNPSRSFKFGVYLPDGSPYVIDFEDTKSPEEPNRLIQISATFSLKRR